MLDTPSTDKVVQEGVEFCRVLSLVWQTRANAIITEASKVNINQRVKVYPHQKTQHLNVQVILSESTHSDLYIRKYIASNGAVFPLTTFQTTFDVSSCSNSLAVVTYMKLLFLLKVYSAGCELDCNLCDLSSYIFNLLRVMVAGSSEETTQGSLMTRRNPQTVISNLDFLLDHFFASMEYSFGTNLDSFISFVSQCKTGESIRSSPSQAGPPLIVSNQPIVTHVNEIFLAHALRGDSNLQSVIDDLLRVGVASPLSGNGTSFSGLVKFLNATNVPSRRKLELCAQRDFSQFVASVELRVVSLEQLSKVDIIKSCLLNHGLFRPTIMFRLAGFCLRSSDASEEFKHFLRKAMHVNSNNDQLTFLDVERVRTVERNKLLNS